MRTLLALLLALGLAGCGLRLDAPDPSPSSPTAAEVVRQREALRAETFAGLAPAGDHADLVAAVAADAAVQLDALGGVWTAWPAGDGPSATADPTHVALGGTAPEVLAALRATTPDLVDAVAVTAGGDAALYGAMAVARSVDADRLALALGEDPPVPTLPAVLTTSDPDVVRAMDAAAYALEELAARAAAADGDAAALAGRAAAWRQRAAVAVAANGWGGTPSDPREPFYVVDDGAAESRIDADLASAFIAGLATPDRDGLLEAAIALATSAARAGEDLGALPGF